ncbi:MAG: hypothetical protein ACPHP2_01165 [Limisphaerales bacterium]
MVFMIMPLTTSSSVKFASSVEAPTTKPDYDHPKICVWYVVAIELFQLPVFIANNFSVVRLFCEGRGHLGGFREIVQSVKNLSAVRNSTTSKKMLDAH